MPATPLEGRTPLILACLPIERGYSAKKGAGESERVLAEDAAFPGVLAAQ
jgi:hypothetical protein